MAAQRRAAARNNNNDDQDPLRRGTRRGLSSTGGSMRAGKSA